MVRSVCNIFDVNLLESRGLELLRNMTRTNQLNIPLSEFSATPQPSDKKVGKRSGIKYSDMVCDWIKKYLKDRRLNSAMNSLSVGYDDKRSQYVVLSQFYTRKT